MTVQIPARVGRPSTGPKVLLPVKVSPDLRKRIKVAAAEEDMTYAELLVYLLDMRDDRLTRQRRAQAHPLHRPAEPVSV